MACANRAGDATLRLHALRLLTSAQIYQGHSEAARALARQGLAEARSLGLRGVEAGLLNVLAIAADRQGDLIGAQELHRQSLQIYREQGDRTNEAIGLMNQGLGWMRLGDLLQGRQNLEAALQLLRANGDRTMEGAAQCALSTLTLWQGDETRALALARQAQEIEKAAQAREYEAFAGIAMGHAELALGRTAAARQAFTGARQCALDLDAPHQHDASAGLARVALAGSDTALALAALQPVLDHVAAGNTLDGTDFPRLIELTCHQTLARAGDPRADEWLARAHTALMAQADAISKSSTDPALRHGFLHNIPHHREIVTAWAAKDSE